MSNVETNVVRGETSPVSMTSAELARLMVESYGVKGKTVVSSKPSPRMVFISAENLNRD